MWSHENLDERQLWLRGTVFLHAFVFVLFLLMTTAWLSSAALY